MIRGATHDWADAREVLFDALDHTVRKESVHAIAPEDAHIPRGTSSGSGRYEELLGLVRFVKPEAWKVLRILRYGWEGWEIGQYAVGPVTDPLYLDTLKPREVRISTAARYLGMKTQHVRNILSVAEEAVWEAYNKRGDRR